MLLRIRANGLFGSTGKNVPFIPCRHNTVRAGLLNETMRSAIPLNRILDHLTRASAKAQTAFATIDIDQIGCSSWGETLAMARSTSEIDRLLGDHLSLLAPAAS